MSAHRRLPWVLVLAAGAGGLATWASLVDGGGTTIVQAAFVAMWAAAGVTVSIRRPEEPVGPTALGGAVLGAAGALAAAGRHEGIATLVLALLPAAALHVLVSFVEPSPERNRVVVVTGYAAAVVVGALLWLTGRPRPLWPVILEGGVATGVLLVRFRRRYRRASPLERRRLRWLGWAVIAGAEISLWAIVSRLVTGWPASGRLILGLASVPLPLALGLSTSRFGAGSVEALLGRTISAAGLTGLVVAVGLVMLAGMDRVPTGRDRSMVGLAMLAAGAASVTYVPLRARLSRIANRLIYGSREPSDQILRTLGTRLSRASPMEELLLQVVESLRTTLALDSAEIWTGSGGRLERTVSVPASTAAHLFLGPEEGALVRRAGVSGTAWARVWLPELLEGREDVSVKVAAIAHSAKLLGLVVAMRAADGQPFTEEEDQVLSELGRHLGLALHNIHLDSALRASLEELEHRAEELQASRARIVAAADTARRHIERNLHDGAQQHLIALIANLRLALQVGKTDPEAANQMLEEVGDGLQRAVQELRTLAHGIYPPLLAQRGLSEALAAAAGGASIEVTADGNRRYPAEIEATVYFCCLEALQNAKKHAGSGARVTVRVWEEAAALRFDVTDDGAGFDPTRRPATGAGFVNMGDRLGAIGGRLTVESAPGRGTRVRGRIPIS